MSPVTGAPEPVTEGLSHTDTDRQLPLNGHAGLKKVRDLLGDQSSLSTFASDSSGDLSGTSDRRSGLTEPAQQQVNKSDDSIQQQHSSQKQLHFSRFVPSQESSSTTNSSVNQYFNPPSVVPSSSYPNYPASHYPNHESRVANRHGPFVFREQTGVRPSSSGGVAGPHNSLRPSSGSLAHSTLHAVDPQSFPPPLTRPATSGTPAHSTPHTADVTSSWNFPPPTISSEEYQMSRFFTDRR
jgi:hypothetical protein